MDFLVAECLVGDICTNITENKKQKQVHRHKNLIRFKLVQNKGKTTCVDACVCICCACANACGVPSDAWHGNVREKMGTMCKHTPIDQNKYSMFNQKETQVLELIRIQYNTKMSLGHSVKHLACNSEFQL